MSILRVQRYIFQLIYYLKIYVYSKYNTARLYCSVITKLSRNMSTFILTLYCYIFYQTLLVLTLCTYIKRMQFEN